MRTVCQTTASSRTASFAWLFFLLLFAEAAYPVTGYDIFLTNRMEDGRPAEERINRFDCSDRIYVVVVAAGLGEGEHELKVRWLDPTGEQKELTRFNFQGSRIANHVWAWLQLPRSNGRNHRPDVRPFIRHGGVHR